ncbi:hypothetical protein PUN28_012921 [Cardiocondyla obscurior]|uniref:Uncharacterized protein n=1 Tax=Cardiocondyla obscurior TaxID=286306 RepID=A0AAW2F627_9HYME
MDREALSRLILLEGKQLRSVTCYYSYANRLHSWSTTVETHGEAARGESRDRKRDGKRPRGKKRKSYVGHGGRRGRDAGRRAGEAKRSDAHTSSTKEKKKKKSRLLRTWSTC